MALIRELAASKHNHLVKEIPDFNPRLMNGNQDNGTLQCNVLEFLQK
jgi:hypothetical protein